MGTPQRLFAGCAVAAMLLITGCMVGEPGDVESGAGTSDPDHLSDDSELPAVIEVLEADESHPDLSDRAMDGTDGVGTIAYTVDPLRNTSFDSAVYFSGSDFQRWRVYQGIADNNIHRTYEAENGGYGLKMVCYDLCVAKQRGYAVPGRYYTLFYDTHGFASDGSPRQRVAVWFYDIELHWLGGRYRYVEDTSDTRWAYSTVAYSPPNTYYVVVEIMYDSDTHTKSRFWYGGAGVQTQF